MRARFLRRTTITAAAILAFGGVVVQPAAAAPTTRPRPVVTSMSTHLGGIGGGTLVIVHGHLGPYPVVFFGGHVARTHRVSDTTVRARAPFSYRPGTVPVQVGDLGTHLRSRPTAAARFTYVGAPEVHGLSAHAGPLGGTRVTFTGSQLRMVRSVTAGGVAARGIRWYSPTKISAVLPPHRAGAVQIRVRTAFGTSPADGEFTQFHYLPRPVVTKLELGNGPTTGGSIEVFGRYLGDLSFPTYVVVGSTRTRVMQQGPSRGAVTVRLPKHAAGNVHVQVQTPGGTSLPTQNDVFTYTGPNSVTWQTYGASGHPNSGAFRDIACPAPGSCFAVDPTSFWSRSASGWTRLGDVVQAPSNREPILTSLSCASTTYCVTVTWAGDAYSWDGSTWISIGQLGSRVDDVSCVAADSCVAVGQTGAWRLAAGSWTPIANAPTVLSSVACTAADTCVVGGDKGEVYRWAAGAWSEADTGQAAEHVVDVDCASADLCVAVDSLTRVATVWRSGTWTAGLVSSDWFVPRGVACAQDMCVALDAYGKTAELRSGTWTDVAPSVIEGFSLRFDQAVDCADATHCVAGDSTGESRTFDGSAWSVAEGLPTQREPTSTSCASATFCAVLDNNGNAYITDRTTSGPSTRVFPAQRRDGDIDCPTSSFCLAVSPSGHAAEYSSGVWKPTSDPGTGLARVSCWAQRQCMAVGVTGARIYGPAGWNPISSPGMSDDLSCASASHCVAAGGDAVSEYDGTGWHRRTLDTDSAFPRGAARVSCVRAATVCVFVSVKGGAYTERGGSWSQRSSIGYLGGVPVSLSCATTTSCMYVTDNFLRWWNGSTWTVAKPLPSDPVDIFVNDVSCAAPRSCLAVGDSNAAGAGYARTG